VLGCKRDADRRAEVDRDAADVERTAQRVEERFGLLGCVRARGKRRQQHGELVGADSGDERGFVDRGFDAARGLGEQRVTDVVPERVVDLAESAEIEEQERARWGCGAGERPVEAPIECLAVRQSGQGVVRRAIFDFTLVCLALGDVAQDHREEPLVVDADPADGCLDRHAAAVDRFDGILPGGQASRPVFAKHVREAGNEALDVFCPEGGDRQAEEPGSRRVRRADAALRVDADDRVARRFDDAPKQRVTALQP